MDQLSDIHCHHDLFELYDLGTCVMFIIFPAILKWSLYFIMQYDHDDKVPFAATTPVSVAVFVVATKVEATAASIPRSIQTFSAAVAPTSQCVLSLSPHSCCTSAADLILVIMVLQGCASVPSKHQTTLTALYDKSCS